VHPGLCERNISKLLLESYLYSKALDPVYKFMSHSDTEPCSGNFDEQLQKYLNIIKITTHFTFQSVLY
jgi:uncharacterized protein YjaG (DUF416 family)